MTAGHQNRIVALNVVQEFMTRSENNKYGHEYIVDPKISDLTPANGQLEVVDNYLLDNAIAHFIQAIYENVTPAWYLENIDLAHEYFTPPNFPTVAINGFGYSVAFNPGREGDDESGEQDDNGDDEETNSD